MSRDPAITLKNVDLFFGGKEALKMGVTKSSTHGEVGPRGGSRHRGPVALRDQSHLQEVIRSQGHRTRLSLFIVTLVKGRKLPPQIG